MRAANLDPNDPLVRAAVFGEKVQEFLRGDIGDFLLKRAETELAAALESLKSVDPGKTTAVVVLQERIRQLEHFESWLGNAVLEGLTAISVIEGEEDAEDA
jgi:hypothetical protein